MAPASLPVLVRTRAAATLAALALLTVGIVGCQPEPSATPSPTASATSTPGPSTASPSPIESELPDASFSLPTSCEQLYSPAMLASLNAQNPPMNDPGVTMTASQNVAALELLASGIPTIRCSWGQPSETGLATNVSVIDAAQSQALLDALAVAGFACEPLADGTVCRTEQTVIDQDDEMVTIGEVHYVRGDGWVSTATIDFSPDGYTEDIVATLWG
ncbi:hypothetical protein [Microbacterium pygmaeum]|uniref:Uncharacterized protein n=1 Tax=Microbacterium pygmaeum TaxID=370764 RepID=A0A1G8C2Z8_9MICO|nr:hypothetical protein [Microbacterium pygmaeum]SDH39861.1 hypothetical protein SAMN04489810_2969 [Microbacterium pygmaeum]